MWRVWIDFFFFKFIYVFFRLKPKRVDVTHLNLLQMRRDCPICFCAFTSLINAGFHPHLTLGFYLCAIFERQGKNKRIDPHHHKQSLSLIIHVTPSRWIFFVHTAATITAIVFSLLLWKRWKVPRVFHLYHICGYFPKRLLGKRGFIKRLIGLSSRPTVKLHYQLCGVFHLTLFLRVSTWGHTCSFWAARRKRRAWAKFNI